MTAAFIRRLTLTNFRSYHAAQVALDRAGPVVLTGANGAGKTNLIEAISLLAPGRGLRRATMEELAFTEGDGAWAVSAEIEGMLGLATLGTGIEPPANDEATPARRCRIDRESVGSATAFADHLRVVWLTPAMDPLFNGPASERRRFLDRLVLAVDAQHSSRVAALEVSKVRQYSLLRAAGFDVIPDPSARLPTHHRLIHPDGVAGFTSVGMPARKAGANFSSDPHTGKLKALICTATPGNRV